MHSQNLLETSNGLFVGRAPHIAGCDGGVSGASFVCHKFLGISRTCYVVSIVKEEKKQMMHETHQTQQLFVQAEEPDIIENFAKLRASHTPGESHRQKSMRIRG